MLKRPHSLFGKSAQSAKTFQIQVHIKRKVLTGCLYFVYDIQPRQPNTMVMQLIDRRGELLTAFILSMPTSLCTFLKYFHRNSQQETGIYCSLAITGKTPQSFTNHVKVGKAKQPLTKLTFDCNLHILPTILLCCCFGSCIQILHNKFIVQEVWRYIAQTKSCKKATTQLIPVKKSFVSGCFLNSTLCMSVQ